MPTTAYALILSSFEVPASLLIAEFSLDLIAYARFSRDLGRDTAKPGACAECRETTLVFLTGDGTPLCFHHFYERLYTVYACTRCVLVPVATRQGRDDVLRRMKAAGSDIIHELYFTSQLLHAAEGGDA